MTIDVEDYFHVSVFDGVVPRSRWDRLETRVCANTEKLLAIFDETRIQGTFFVLGWVAERWPHLVRQIAERGHEIASHGFGHRLVYDQTPRQFREDVRRAKALLEAAAGTQVFGYRAPSYSITPRSLWALDVLIEEGFRYDASIFPVHHDRYGIPVSCYAHGFARLAACTVPVAFVTLRPDAEPDGVRGGGRQARHGGIARLNRVERRPAIFYLHPWEIDPAQPRLEAPLISRFRHYRNLDRTEARLRSLLRDFQFGPLLSVFAAADPCDAPSAALALPYYW